MILEGIEGAADRTLLLLLAAVFPGSTYFHATFPISMFVCLILLSILLLVRHRQGAGAVAGALAAVTYATGFLMSAVVGVGVLATSAGRAWPGRLARAVLCGGVVCAGFGAVLVLHEVVLGHWNALFLIQASYGNGLHDPLAAAPRLVENLLQGTGGMESFVAAAQSLAVGVLVIVALARVLWRARRASALDWIAATQVALFWIVPLAAGPRASLYRNEANLLPLVFLLARWPRTVLLVLLMLFTLLRFGASVGFFRAVLV
jgi:hypothetical protein